MKKLPGLSGFLLAFNEEENIEKAVLALCRALKTYALQYEVLVVLHGGSTDRTKTIVTKMAKKDKHIRLVMQPIARKGYGNAIRIGIEASKMPYVFFSDADNQFDFKDISRLVKYVPSYGVVTGYRKERKDPFMRVMIAKAYNLLLKLFFPLPVRDVDCAFKIYRREIFDAMDLVCTTGMVNAEIITKASIGNFGIKEVPVPHYHRFAGRPVFETGKWAMIKPQVVIDLLKEMKLLWGSISRKRR